jgi:hypothetical protein
MDLNPGFLNYYFGTVVSVEPLGPLSLKKENTALKED